MMWFRVSERPNQARLFKNLVIFQESSKVLKRETTSTLSGQITNWISISCREVSNIEICQWSYGARQISVESKQVIDDSFS